MNRGLPLKLPEYIWQLTPELAALHGTAYADALDAMLDALDETQLFHSHLHGQGHVLRVLVLGALLAQRAGLDPNWTRLLMLACAYHDVGRIDDSVDMEHGLRAVPKLQEITGLVGEPLRCLQAAVEAHSRPDRKMNDVLAKYGLAHNPDALQLARLLKDADGLDRVRLDVLDPSYLRHAFTPELEPVAWQLLAAWP